MESEQTGVIAIGVDSKLETYVLVADDDLFFSIRIETTLRKLGYRVTTGSTPDETMSAARSEPPGLVIVNFASRSFEAGALVRALKELSTATPVLAFMPHKQMPELAPNAKSAGCDQIVANSALTMRLPQLVEKYLRKQPAS